MVGAGKTTLLEHLKIGTVDTSEDGSVKSVVYGQTELYSWDLPGASALPPERAETRRVRALIPSSRIFRYACSLLF